MNRLFRLMHRAPRNDEAKQEPETANTQSMGEGLSLAPAPRHIKKLPLGVRLCHAASQHCVAKNNRPSELRLIALDCA